MFARVMVGDIGLFHYGAVNGLGILAFPVWLTFENY